METNNKNSAAPVHEDLKSQVKKIRQYSKEWLQAVNYVITDQNSILEGKELYFAIDFKHVYEYAFPADYLESNNESIGANNSHFKEFLWHKLAGISFLFNNIHEIKRPILLAPYAAELVDFLKYYHSHRVFEDIYQLDYFNLDENEKNLIKSCSTLIKKNYSIAVDDKIAIEKLIRKKFSSLFMLITGFSERGITCIKELINNKQLIIESDIALDYSKIAEEIIEDPISSFSDFFDLVRPGRYKQNYRDMKSLEITVGLNKHFLNEGINKRLYLLSDAFLFKSIFDFDSFINLREKEIQGLKLEYEKCKEDDEKKNLQKTILNKELEIKEIKKEYQKVSSNLSIYGSDDTLLRTPYIFVAYMMHSKKHVNRSHPAFTSIRKDLIKRLEDRRGRLLKFNFFGEGLDKLADTCDGNCSECSNDMKQSCCKLKNDIDQWLEVYNDKVSLDLLSNYESLKAGYANEFKDKIQKGLNAIIQYLNDPSDSFKDKIVEERKKLDKIYQKTVNELNILIKKNSISLHEELIFRLKPLRRIPFQVTFECDKINLVLKEVSDFVKEYDSLSESDRNKPVIVSKIDSLSNKILGYAFDKKCGNESSLLFALLNLNFNKFQNVINIINHCLSIPNLMNKSEYSIIKIIALNQYACNIRDNVYYNEAKTLCEKELKKNRDDSRFYYLFGVLIGRGLQTNLEKEYKIQDSINYFEQALNYLKPNNEKSLLLEAHIKNSMAFASCLSEEIVFSDSFEIAPKAIESMTQLINEKEWDANFIDTKGIVLYYSARRSSDEDEIIELLKESKNCLVRALDMAEKNKYLSYEIRAIEKHFAMSKELLASYSNSERESK